MPYCRIIDEYDNILLESLIREITYSIDNETAYYGAGDTIVETQIGPRQGHLNINFEYSSEIENFIGSPIVTGRKRIITFLENRVSNVFHNCVLMQIMYTGHESDFEFGNMQHVIETTWVFTPDVFDLEVIVPYQTSNPQEKLDWRQVGF